MTVAAVLASNIVSGPGRQLAALGQALRGKGHILHVLLLHRSSQPPSPLAEHFMERDVAVTIVEERFPFDPALIARTNKVLQELKPSVLQTHGYKPTAVAAALKLVGDLSVPWIGFYHGGTAESRRVRLYDQLDRLLLRSADRIAVISGTQARLLGDGPRVRVLPNAVLPEFIAAAGGEASVKTADSGVTLGYLGRLSPEKGVDILLAAFKELLAERSDLELVVAGDGPERQRLERQMTSLAIEENVRFLGRISAIAPFFRSVDCLILPSRSEGLPNTLLEALAFDCPVVATSVGAVPDVVGESEAAVLVEPESPVGLAEGIRTALRTLASPSARQDRAAAVGRFSIEARTQRHLELYDELLAERGRRPPAA